MTRPSPSSSSTSTAHLAPSQGPNGGDVRVSPRRFGTLRTGAARGLERVCAALGGRRYYRARHLARGRLVEREERIGVPGLPVDLAGLSIAHLSDLHAGPFLGAGDLAPVVDATNARGPDLIVLTGDFVTHRWSEALLVLDDLARLEAPLGCFAVFGNHDYRGRCDGEIEAAYRERGIRFLRNDCARVAVGERGATLGLVGLEDLEEARVLDLERARAPLAPGDVEVVLCHNPRGAIALVREGCPLILSGHTHGGQVNLPWISRLGPQHPGLRVDFGPTTLIVSRGLGVVGAPLRVGAPAEVVHVTLVPAGSRPDPVG